MGFLARSGRRYVLKMFFLGLFLTLGGCVMTFGDARLQWFGVPAEATVSHWGGTRVDYQFHDADGKRRKGSAKNHTGETFEPGQKIQIVYQSGRPQASNVVGNSTMGKWLAMMFGGIALAAIGGFLLIKIPAEE